MGLAVVADPSLDAYLDTRAPSAEVCRVVAQTLLTAVGHLRGEAESEPPPGAQAAKGAEGSRKRAKVRGSSQGAFYANRPVDAESRRANKARVKSAARGVVSIVHATAPEGDPQPDGDAAEAEPYANFLVAAVRDPLLLLCVDADGTAPLLLHSRTGDGAERHAPGGVSDDDRGVARRDATALAIAYSEGEADVDACAMQGSSNTASRSPSPSPCEGGGRRPLHHGDGRGEGVCLDGENAYVDATGLGLAAARAVPLATSYAAASLSMSADAVKEGDAPSAFDCAALSDVGSEDGIEPEPEPEPDPDPESAAAGGTGPRPHEGDLCDAGGRGRASPMLCDDGGDWSAGYVDGGALDGDDFMGDADAHHGQGDDATTRHERDGAGEDAARRQGDASEGAAGGCDHVTQESPRPPTPQSPKPSVFAELEAEPASAPAAKAKTPPPAVSKPMTRRDKRLADAPPAPDKADPATLATRLESGLIIFSAHQDGMVCAEAARGEPITLPATPYRPECKYAQRLVFFGNVVGVYPRHVRDGHPPEMLYVTVFHHSMSTAGTRPAARDWQPRLLSTFLVETHALEGTAAHMWFPVHAAPPVELTADRDGLPRSFRGLPLWLSLAEMRLRWPSMFNAALETQLDRHVVTKAGLRDRTRWKAAIARLQREDKAQAQLLGEAPSTLVDEVAVEVDSDYDDLAGNSTEKRPGAIAAPQRLTQPFAPHQQLAATGMIVCRQLSTHRRAELQSLGAISDTTPPVEVERLAAQKLAAEQQLAWRAAQHVLKLRRLQIETNRTVHGTGAVLLEAGDMNAALLGQHFTHRILVLDGVPFQWTPATLRDMDPEDNGRIISMFEPITHKATEELMDNPACNEMACVHLRRMKRAQDESIAAMEALRRGDGAEQSLGERSRILEAGRRAVNQRVMGGAGMVALTVDDCSPKSMAARRAFLSRHSALRGVELPVDAGAETPPVLLHHDVLRGRGAPDTAKVMAITFSVTSLLSKVDGGVIGQRFTTVARDPHTVAAAYAVENAGCRQFGSAWRVVSTPFYLVLCAQNDLPCPPAVLKYVHDGEEGTCAMAVEIKTLLERGACSKAETLTELVALPNNKAAWRQLTSGAAAALLDGEAAAAADDDESSLSKAMRGALVGVTALPVDIEGPGDAEQAQTLVRLAMFELHTLLGLPVSTVDLVLLGICRQFLPMCGVDVRCGINGGDGARLQPLTLQVLQQRLMGVKVTACLWPWGDGKEELLNSVLAMALERDPYPGPDGCLEAMQRCTRRVAIVGAMMMPLHASVAHGVLFAPAAQLPLGEWPAYDKKTASDKEIHGQWMPNGIALPGGHASLASALSRGTLHEQKQAAVAVRQPPRTCTCLVKHKTRAHALPQQAPTCPHLPRAIYVAQLRMISALRVQQGLPSVMFNRMKVDAVSIQLMLGTCDHIDCWVRAALAAKQQQRPHPPHQT